MQFADFQAHADAQCRIQIRQGFVEQERRRFADDRATDGDALPLPARQLPRAPVEVICQVQRLGGCRDALFLLGLIDTGHA